MEKKKFGQRILEGGQSFDTEETAAASAAAAAKSPPPSFVCQSELVAKFSWKEGSTKLFCWPSPISRLAAEAAAAGNSNEAKQLKPIHL
jgi:hypothetical protein